MVNSIKVIDDILTRISELEEEILNLKMCSRVREVNSNVEKEKENTTLVREEFFTQRKYGNIKKEAKVS
jgi:hypothetical protein